MEGAGKKKIYSRTVMGGSNKEEQKVAKPDRHLCKHTNKPQGKKGLEKKLQGKGPEINDTYSKPSFPGGKRTRLRTGQFLARRCSISEGGEDSIGHRSRGVIVGGGTVNLERGELM